MNKNEYFAIIARWHDIYGVPKREYKYDPTVIRTCCYKCKKMKSKMARHHKGNDLFFAFAWPDLYAKRYIQFLPEDIAKLCDDCHHAIERYSKKLKETLYDEYAVFKLTTHTLIEINEWVESWHIQFINHYNKWVVKPVRKKRRKKSRSRVKHKVS